MKTLFIVLGLLLVVAFARHCSKEPASPLIPLPVALSLSESSAPCTPGTPCGSSRIGGQVLQFVDDELYDRQVMLSSLAEPGVYTVVTFTSVHCSLSHWLERYMTAFVAARRDVVVKNVRVFSGSVFFMSRDEMAAWQARRSGIKKRFNLDFSPKVYVFGPDGSPIIGERSNGGEGYFYLRRWIQAEVPGS